MSSLLSNKLLVFVVLGILVAAVVWYGFLGGSAPDAPLLTNQDITASGDPDSDVVKTLLSLQAVSLSGTIFSDPAFMTLKDFGNEIVEEPVGRPNPFAPIGGSASSSGQGGINTGNNNAPGSNSGGNPGGTGVPRPIPPKPVQ